MRLIDAEQYRKEFLDSRDFEPMKILDFQPTVQAIPLDKVKQAREEMENIDWKSCSSKIVDGNRVKTELIDRKDALAILDRLIVESET